MSRRPVSNNPQAQERLRGRDKDRARRYYDALRFVYETPQGRIVLRRLLGPMVDPSFTGSSETFYREGRRSVAIDLMHDLNVVEPMAYAKLVAEDAAEKQEEKTHQHDAATHVDEDNDE